MDEGRNEERREKRGREEEGGREGGEGGGRECTIKRVQNFSCAQVLKINVHQVSHLVAQHTTKSAATCTTGMRVHISSGLMSIASDMYIPVWEATCSSGSIAVCMVWYMP